MAINNAQLTVALDKTVVGAGIGINCAQATYAPEWIKVYYGTNKDVAAVYNTDYTVAVAGDFDSHTVTPTAGFITKLNNLGQGYNIRVIRETPSNNDITPTDAFVRAKLEAEFNTLSMRVAELHYLIDNIQVSSGGTGPGTGDVLGDGTALVDEVTVYNNVNGKRIKSSGIAKSDLFLKSAGGTIQDNVVITGTGVTRSLMIDGSAGFNRTLGFSTLGELRWSFSAGPQAENGGNVGSTFGFNSYDDNGDYLDTPMYIERATSFVTFAKRVQFNGLSTFFADLVSGNPRFTYDTNDYMEYDRAANSFRFTIGSTLAARVSAFGLFNIASDANFYIDKNGTTTEVSFDASDLLTYDRTANEFKLTIGGGVKYTFGNGYAFSFSKMYFFDAVNVDPASGAPGAPEDGDIWSTTKVFYMRANGQTGVVPHEQFLLLSADYVLANQTAAQKAFNIPVQGALNAKAATSYEFEGVIMLSGMSGSSGTFGFALGGTATLTSIQWGSSAMKSTLATQVAPTVTENVTAANVALTAANTNTDGAVRVKGVVRVNAAGTLIPQISLGVASAATVKIGSYFKFRSIADNVATSQGDFV